VNFILQKGLPFLYEFFHLHKIFYTLKEDTTVEYSDNTLTISANHESHTEDKEDGNYVRKERHSVSYKRSFYLPNVDEEKITGTFKNGVLKLVLPKTAYQPKETKKIELN
ncbi:Hsp20/alpha crystallin family protein, partial [Enterococcus faecium]|uniref:Hsp20/alpha crystallin family protein n=1 Tax=Enterococcus faecium TaxID=1352 RepID=UPI003CC541BE